MVVDLTEQRVNRLVRLPVCLISLTVDYNINTIKSEIMSTPETDIMGSNGGASGATRGNNHRCNGLRRINNQATITPIFEGSEPLLKGLYDLPSKLNHDQFSKTTKKMDQDDGDHNGFRHGHLCMRSGNGIYQFGSRHAGPHCGSC